ncbi:MAG: MBL fold metallo-hydrolase [Christensenellales bacterium]|jgi:competence protein ComEC
MFDNLIIETIFMGREDRMFRQRIWVAAFLVLVLFLTGCAGLTGVSVEQPDDALLQAHVINVGKADCILLVQGENAMLIDAGNQADEAVVIQYIRSMGIDTLDYVIATHPHEDHIGGMTAVIRNFTIKNFILPDVAHNTQVFENMLDIAKRKGLLLDKPDLSKRYPLGKAEFSIVAPNSRSYEQLNDYSIVCKVEFEQIAMLFCGDAEALSEREMLDRGYDLSAALLKAGHHGSDSSSTREFLAAVGPRVAVLTADEQDRTGGPGKTALKNLRDTGAEIYRSDTDGHILAQTNGETLEIRTQNQVKADEIFYIEKPQHSSAPTDSQQVVQKSYIGNKNSKKVHLPSCSGLPKEENRVYFGELEEAWEQGYSPCQRCLSEERL